jgi:hypothetical protein
LLYPRFVTTIDEQLASSDAEECASGLRAIIAGAKPTDIGAVERLAGDQRSVEDPAHPGQPKFVPIAALARDALVALGKVDAEAAAGRPAEKSSLLERITKALADWM